MRLSRCASLLLLLAAACLCVQAQIRGVRPRDIERYSQAEFRCTDGSATVPAALINDDYCDCADGSDEPGTSACVNSRFYCRNLGAKGKTLPSSRVNDGVCDCCDGTDEVESYSHVSCANTCQEAGRADRERMEREIASTEAGWTTRLTLVQKAAVSINEKRAKMAHYEKLMNDRIVLKEAARQLKEAEEAVENTERARREAEKIKADEEKKAAEAKIEADRAAAAGEAPAAVPAAAAVPEGLVLADLTDAPVASSATTTETASTIPAGAATPAAATEAAKPAEENFPYPAEYAYKAADVAPAATEGDAAAAPASFPYPAEYAYNPDAPVANGGEAEATGKIPASTAHSDHDGETVEPEYADDEHEQHGDDDDDDENEPDHSEQQHTEAEYVHPGGHESTPTKPTPTPEPKTVSPASQAISALEAAIAPLTAAHAYWTSITTWTAELVSDTASTVKDVCTGHYPWASRSRRWLQRTLDGLEYIGESSIGLWNKIAGGSSAAVTLKHPPGSVADASKPPAADLWKSPAAESARAAYDKIESKVVRLQKKMDELKKTLDKDFGPQAQFAHWDGNCYPLQIKQYTYEVCPYGRASQKEGHGSTSLGSWEGLETKEDGSVQLKFKGGQTCWQGPQRSLTVKLRCGAEDKPLTVEEPSKCVYEMEMETPAVCNMEHAQALKLNLESGGLIEEEEEQ